MKKKALVIILLSAALSLSACGQSDNNTENSKDIEELELKIAELEKENKQLKELLEADKATESSNSELDNFVAETSGICGENLTWEYGNGILYIHGTGAMSDYDVQHRTIMYDKSNYLEYSKLPTPWLDIREKIAKVIIEDGCTSIGNNAFEECIALSNIIIPDTVSTIGTEAFYNCSNLRNITIPDSVVAIDDYAFNCCQNLNSITIPDSVVTFGNDVFSPDIEIVYNGTGTPTKPGNAAASGAVPASEDADNTGN